MTKQIKIIKVYENWKYKKSNFFLIVLSLIIPFTVSSQSGGWNVELSKEWDEALKRLIEATPEHQSFQDKAYRYVIFPKVSKAGLILVRAEPQEGF